MDDAANEMISLNSKTVHTAVKIFGVLFVLRILYLANSISAVIHIDNIINVDDIWSIISIGEILTNDDVLKNISIFIVNNIIVRIEMCQYIVVSIGSRSSLLVVKIMSSICLM